MIETQGIDADLTSMGSELAVMAAKGAAITVGNRFKSIREKTSREEICNSYEDLINELVRERARAIAIAQGYESELSRYTITDEDIVHLQNTISTVLDLMKVYSPGVKTDDLEKFKSLISADTLKAMQLLGFDYKAAIGDPLTKACASAIERKLMPSGRGNNKPGLRRQKN